MRLTDDVKIKEGKAVATVASLFNYEMKSDDNGDYYDNCGIDRTNWHYLQKKQDDQERLQKHSAS